MASHAAPPLTNIDMTQFHLPLTVLAAAALPCFAAQQPATTVFQEMSAVPVVSPATPEQRAAVLGSLALLPADIEAFFAMTKPGQSAKDIVDLPLVQLIDPCEPGPILMGLHDVALGFGPGTAAIMQRLNKMQPALKALQTEIAAAPFLNNTRSEAQIKTTQEQDLQQLVALTGGMAAAVFDDPHGGLCLTAVGRLAPNTMAAWKKQANDFMEMCREKNPKGVSKFEGKFSGHDFTGVKVDLGQALADKQQMAEAAKALKGRVVYILWTIVGDHAVVTVTQDPARQIRLAKSPAESVLSGGKAAFADARLNADVRAVFQMDAPVVAALCDYGKADNQGTIQGVSKVITQMEGMLGSVPAAGLKAALSGMNALYNQVIDSYGKGEATFIAWKQNGLRMEMTYGGTSLIDLGKPLVLTPLADTPGNVCYAEGAYTPEGSAMCMNFLGELGKLAWYGLDAAANVEKCNSPSRPGQLQTSAMMMNMLSPALNQWWSSWKQLDSGLAPRGALIADLEEAPAAEGTGALPNPRVALYRPVTDRAAMASGWQGMVKAADNMAGAFGLQPGTVEAFLKPAVTDRGEGVTDYGLNLDGTTVLASVSDKTLIVGNSPDLNAAVMKTLAADPASARRGMAWCVRFAPLTSAARKGVAPGGQLGLDQDETATVNQVAEATDQSVDGVFGLYTRENDRMRTSIYIKTN